MITLGDTKVLGATTVNEFHVGFLRNVNNIGQPHGGLGVIASIAGLRHRRGHAGGIVVQAPQFEGVENIVFPFLRHGRSDHQSWTSGTTRCISAIPYRR